MSPERAPLDSGIRGCRSANIVAGAARREILGGGTLHHLDAERAIIESGYWRLPHARGRGVEAYVTVGNEGSDRVLARAGFAREGVCAVAAQARWETSRQDAVLASPR